MQMTVPAGLAQGSTANAPDVVAIANFINGKNLDSGNLVDQSLPVHFLGSLIVSGSTVVPGVTASRVALLPKANVDRFYVFSCFATADNAVDVFVLNPTTVYIERPGENNAAIVVDNLVLNNTAANPVTYNYRVYLLPS